jgi:hypothetical protein
MVRRRGNSKKKSKKSQDGTPKILSQLVTLLNNSAPPPKPKIQSFGPNMSRPALGDPRRYKLAMIDPFNNNAKGVKVPDFDGNPSFTLRSYETFTITTDANGAACGCFQFATPVRRSVTATVTAGVGNLTTTPVSSNWSDYSGAGLLAATSSNASRLVAGGFKIESIMNLAGATPAAGKMIIAPVPNSLLFDTSSFSESDLRKAIGSRTIPLAALTASSLPVVGSTRTLDPSALCYLATSYNLTGVANDDPQFLSFVYLVIGAPVSQAILQVDMVAHWECLPTLPLSTLATVGVRSSAAILDEVANMSQQSDTMYWGTNWSDYMPSATTLGRVAGAVGNFARGANEANRMYNAGMVPSLM